MTGSTTDPHPHSDLQLRLKRPPRTARFTRRNFLLGSAASVAGFALYSGEIARHELSIVTQTIPIARLPLAFHDYRIVQISDIHFDEFTEPAFLRRVINRVNALNADLVLLTGDFVSEGPLPNSFSIEAAHRCAEILKTLACPLRYAVSGNHDVVVGLKIVGDALAQAHVPMLVNSYLPIERGPNHLWLAGLADPSTAQPNLHLAIPEKPDAPILLMCHGPDFADQVVNHPRGRFVDLMLSGHSHGGQVRLPFLGPIRLPPWGSKYVEGLFHLLGLQLYVNRGIGTVGLPFRLNCPPEITLFTLQPA